MTLAQSNREVVLPRRPPLGTRLMPSGRKTRCPRTNECGPSVGPPIGLGRRGMMTLLKSHRLLARALGAAMSHRAKLGERQSPQTSKQNRGSSPQSLASAIAEETLPPALNERRRGQSLAKLRSGARRESAWVGSSRASVDRNRRAAQPSRIGPRSLSNSLTNCLLKSSAPTDNGGSPCPAVCGTIAPL